MSALTRASLSIAVLLLPGLAKVSPAHAAQEAESVDGARAVHLLQRATYGPRPQNIDAVLSAGIADWLDRQLHPERIDDSELEPLLAGAPVASMSLAELLKQYPPGQVLQPVREIVQSDSLMGSERRRLRRELGEHSPRRILADLAAARLTRAVHSERQLQEMMTAFLVRPLQRVLGQGRHPLADPRLRTKRHSAPRVREVRGHGSGNRQTPGYALLPRQLPERRPRRLASGPREARRHPQRMRRMPAGTRARERATQRMEERRRRRRGLNENYARELLELHTLGVDEDYTQADVIDVARILTGWTFQQAGNRMDMRQARASYEDGRLVLPEIDYEEAYRFRFRSELHDAGEKHVMGHVFDAGGG